jgi:hypothetical protein
MHEKTTFKVKKKKKKPELRGILVFSQRFFVIIKSAQEQFCI